MAKILSKLFSTLEESILRRRWFSDLHNLTKNLRKSQPSINIPFSQYTSNIFPNSSGTA